MTKRAFYFILAWLFFGIGFVGVFLPVLPTTPFMILALWSFSKSSQRFHNWLYSHKLFGPPLQLWHEHRVIPVIAKCFSLFFMSASLVYLHFFAALSNWVTLPATLFIAYGCWYILTKPSRVPTT